MSVQIIEKDTGWLKLVKEIQLAGHSYTKVGYLSDDKKEPNSGKKQVAVIDVAIVHEFGAPSRNIPQRSFIRSYFDENQAKITNLTKNLYAQIIAGSITTKKALGLVGEFVKKGIQEKITKGPFKELAAATIAERLIRMSKSRTKKQMAKVLEKPVNDIVTPLIDTGTMRASVTHTEVIE